MVADSYSPTLGYIRQVTGNNNNTWGDIANDSIFAIFERAIAGYATHAVTGGNLDLTTDAPPAGPSAMLDQFQYFSGTLTSDCFVIVPNLSKVWYIFNATDENEFLLSMRTPSGGSVIIPRGRWSIVWCDGDDEITASTFVGADGTEAAPGLAFTAESGTGIRRAGAGDMRMVVLGNDQVTVTAGGMQVEGLVRQGGSGSLMPIGGEMSYAGIYAPLGWLFEMGQDVDRDDYALLLDAITAQSTGATTSGNATISSVANDLRGLGLEGAVIEGGGIPSGRTIVSITETTIVMSGTASGSVTGALRIFPWGNGDGSTTFTVPDCRGVVTAGREVGTSWLTEDLDGTRLGEYGGDQTHQLTGDEMASHFHDNTLTVDFFDPGHFHSYNTFNNQVSKPGGGGSSPPDNAIGANTGSKTTGITVDVSIFNADAGNDQPHNNVQPTRIANMIIFTGRFV